MNVKAFSVAAGILWIPALRAYFAGDRARLGAHPGRPVGRVADEITGMTRARRCAGTP